MPDGEAQGDQRCLIARARARPCALPLQHVLEIMRPLPIEPIAHAPSFVLGVAIVRGEPAPVIDCGALLQASGRPAHTRWASVRAGTRCAVLAFEGIDGVRLLPGPLAKLPPLLAGAPSEQIERLALLDAELHLVLCGSRLIPEDALRVLEGAPA